MPTPDELRSRAASIFQQLRTGAPGQRETPPDEEEQAPGEHGEATEALEAVEDAGRPAEDAGAGPNEPIDGATEAAEPVEPAVFAPDEPEVAEALEGAQSEAPAIEVVETSDTEPSGDGSGPTPVKRDLWVVPTNPVAEPTAAQETAAQETAAQEAVVEIALVEAPAQVEASAPEPQGTVERQLPPAPEPPPAPPPRPRRPLPRVLAIANQKGGVGKTTTAVNLGAALAELGYRVLVIDLDPQGNATTGLGVNARNLDVSIYDVILRDVPIEDCIEPTSLRNLFVVPATIDLAGAEVELVSMFSRELRLKRAVDSLHGEFDFTLIDCPPSLGLLTVNGLAAATEVVVPIQCEYYALEGLGQLLRNVSLVQTNLNPQLEVSSIVLTMFDARTRLAEQVVNEVRSHFGDKVCRNVVPRTVRLSEAPSFGQPIIVFDSSSRGAIAYRELAKEVSGGTPQRIG